MRKDEKILLLAPIVFFISFLLRAIYLNSIPNNLVCDEADTLRTYLMAKYTGNPSLLGFNWTGAPAINTYLIGFFWQLFNQSFFGLRFASSLISSLSVVIFFVLSARLTRKKWLASSLSLALATNPWFLNFSRSGWENIFNAFTLMLIFLGFYFLYQKQALRLSLLLLIAGSVLGFYFYHPGKLFIPAVIFTLLLISNTKIIKVHFLTIFLFSFFSFLLILPQLKQAVIEKEKSFGRVKTVSILNKPNSFNLLKTNLKRNLRGFLFFKKKDFNIGLNTRYLPLDFNPIQPLLIPLYLIGLGIALFRHHYYFLFYYAVLLPVQALSEGTPDASRAVHVIPAIYLFILLGADFILNKLYSLKPLYYKWAYISLIFLILIISISDAKIYFNWIANFETLKAREPAIWKDEYRTWLSALEESIKSKGVDFNVGQWKEKISRDNEMVPIPFDMEDEVITN